MKFSKKCIQTKCIKQKTKLIAYEKSKQNENDQINIKFYIFERFNKIFKKSKHQMFCLYFKNKFERKLKKYSKKLLIVIMNVIQQNDHEKFMKSKQKYIIEK